MSNEAPNPKSSDEELRAAPAQAAEELGGVTAHAAEEVAAVRASAARDLEDARATSKHLLEDARASAARDLESVRAKAAEDLDQAHVDERQCDLACMERLVDAFRDLDAAASLTEVLDRLTEHSSALITGRLAVLVVRGQVLCGWKVAGFGGSAPDAAGIRVDCDGHSIAARAVRRCERTTTRDAEAEAMPFAPLPDDRVGFAVPLIVGNRPVAVLYADDVAATHPTVPSAWPEAMEILARHAARCLELLTIGRAYGLHVSSGSRDWGLGSGGSFRQEDQNLRPETADKIGVSRPEGRNLGVKSEEGEPGGAQGLLDDEGESAQRYARLLISEIKLYHEDAVDAGCRDGNLLERLGAEIERARRLYEQRVPVDVRGRADYFGQELVRTLANGDPRLLGLET